jgi:hypothetical protein
MTDTSKSIRTRLLNIARKENISFQLVSKGNMEIQIFWQVAEEMIKSNGNVPRQWAFLVFRVNGILSVNLHNISTEHGNTTIEKGS